MEPSLDRVVEQSERYADVVEFMKEIFDKCYDDLDIKSLLRFGFKKIISAQRSD